jgi:eukaryotic-like serine/threonine-protein kinase
MRRDGSATTGSPPGAVERQVIGVRAASAGNACPSAEEVTTFLDGNLPSAKTAALEAHAAACAACRALLSALARADSGIAPELLDSRAVTRVASRDAAGPVGRQEEAFIAAGTTMGRYTVLERIGAGGMGIVHAALDPELDRRVALKILRTEILDADVRTAVQERLLREARAMAQLAHPNVVAVYELGRYENQVFVAMELVEGQTLSDWLAERNRDWREVVDVFLAAGRGLAAAHVAGLVHRDFKPENVLIGRDGRVRVTDFGLVQYLMSGPQVKGEATVTGPVTPRLTLSGSLMGTPHYMAPEQFRGELAEARTDQFSFCVTIYRALYGRPPFAGATVEELADEVTSGRVRPPPRRTPAWLQRAVLRGLSVRPEDRFPTMESLLAALNREPIWRRRAVAAGGLLTLIGWVAIAALTGPAEEADERCTGAAAAYASTWNPHRRSAIEKAFVASHAPSAISAVHQVTAALDRYAARWIEAHTATCRATRILGEQTDATLDLRMTCLERRRQEADALATTLAAASATAVERSVDAALGLPDVAVCADIATLGQMAPPPGDRVLRAKIAALASRLARADANHRTGSYAAGLALARPILADARALGYRPLEAEAALVQAQLELALGDRRSAEASFEATVWAAEAGRHDAIAAQAWAHLVYLVGNGNAEYARGLSLVPRATAAIARLGGNPAIEALLENALGSIDLSQSKVEASIPHFEKAVALHEQAHGREHPETARALEGLAMALLKQGDASRAAALLQRALDILERMLGSVHPHVARVWALLGNAHAVAGDSARGEKELRHALAMREAIFDPNHPEIIANLGHLGRALRFLGRAEEALEIDRRQIAVAERAFGSEHPTFAKLSIGLGLSLAQTGRYAEAAKHLHRAEAILTKLHGPDHVMVLIVHVVFGDILIARSRWREAITAFEALLPAVERAQEAADARQDVRVNLALAYIELHRPARALAVLQPLVEQVDREAPAWQGQIHFMQARALWDGRRDRTKAREHAALARVAFKRATLPDELAKVDRWLASHRAR